MKTPIYMGIGPPILGIELVRKKHILCEGGKFRYHGDRGGQLLGRLGVFELFLDCSSTKPSIFFGTPHKLAERTGGWPSGQTSHKLWLVIFVCGIFLTMKLVVGCKT